MHSISLPLSNALAVANDPLSCALAAKLIYVSDSDDGISRVRKNGTFRYLMGGKLIRDKEVIERIRKIVIPPAWENVWICKKENGHIQATGVDVKGRKQYRYHPLWNEMRNHTKFSRLFGFGQKLPLIRLQIEEDLADTKLSRRKVLAAIISLMERTYIRIGNIEYEKLYQSYGLTTMKDKHVQIDGSSLKFCFRGKKGVSQEISLNHRKLARIVKECREIPGKELFQYYDSNGERHAIDSGDVNEYIQSVTGDDCTAKDFRTWAGTLHALIALKELGISESQTETKKKLTEAYDIVSSKLGNTRTVCKKYYVHPVIPDLYEKKLLHSYFKQLEAIEKNDQLSGWTAEERVLMKILKKPTQLRIKSGHKKTG